jgi:hypothetical protein
MYAEEEELEFDALASIGDDNVEEDLYDAYLIDGTEDRLKLDGNVPVVHEVQS